MMAPIFHPSQCPCPLSCTFALHHGQDSLCVNTLYLDTELSHVTCFGHCNVSRWDGSRGLKRACALVCSSLHFCRHHEGMPRLACYRTSADTFNSPSTAKHFIYKVNWKKYICNVGVNIHFK